VTVVLIESQNWQKMSTRRGFQAMPSPKGIDPEALELLIEDDWPWDDWLFGFRRARRSHESVEAYDQRPPDLITCVDLEDQGLINVSPKAPQREKALEWLRARIKSAPRL
jgi:hypothetical protein